MERSYSRGQHVLKFVILTPLFLIATRCVVGRLSQFLTARPPSAVCGDTARFDPLTLYISSDSLDAYACTAIEADWYPYVGVNWAEHVMLHCMSGLITLLGILILGITWYHLSGQARKDRAYDPSAEDALKHEIFGDR